MPEKAGWHFTCTDMEDGNISVQKFSVSADINISEIPLEFSDALFLKC
jgi:hypothetical protein